MQLKFKYYKCNYNQCIAYSCVDNDSFKDLRTGGIFSHILYTKNVVETIFNQQFLSKKTWVEKAVSPTWAPSGLLTSRPCSQQTSVLTRLEVWHSIPPKRQRGSSLGFSLWARWQVISLSYAARHRQCHPHKSLAWPLARTGRLSTNARMERLVLICLGFGRVTGRLVEDLG